MIEAARGLAEGLIVVVNNDKQQLLKKGKIILDETNRVRLIRSLRDVDEVVLSIDEEPPVIKTLEMIAKQHEKDELIFCNGGDRNSHQDIPETEVCKKYGIETVFGVGGATKADSSTRINQSTGHELS